MPEIKPKFANFPEHQTKVVIGPNINAQTTKTLGRLSIGTYEMSFVQKERGDTTREAARLALSHISRALTLTLTSEDHRDFVGTLVAANAEHRFQVWVTTPFELTQSAHIVWVKYNELTGEGRTGIAFKLATSFTLDEIENLVKNTQKNAVKLADGEHFTLKGNPHPRFTKKVVPAEGDAATADVEAQSTTGTAPVTT